MAAVSDRAKQNQKDYQRRWYEANKERVAKLGKKRYEEKKGEIKEWHKNNYLKNKGSIDERSKAYYTENREKILKQQKDNYDPEKRRDYYYKNRDHILKQKKEYQPIANKRRRERKLHDPVYKLSTRYRCRLAEILKGKGVYKSKSAEVFLGCTYAHLKDHLESKFKDGMIWSNYGTLWEMDHIFPLSWCDTEEELFIYSHYSNIQPLLASENRNKSNRYIG